MINIKVFSLHRLSIDKHIYMTVFIGLCDTSGFITLKGDLFRWKGLVKVTFTYLKSNLMQFMVCLVLSHFTFLVFNIVIFFSV